MANYDDSNQVRVSSLSPVSQLFEFVVKHFSSLLLRFRETPSLVYAPSMKEGAETADVAKRDTFNSTIQSFEVRNRLRTIHFALANR